MEIVAKPANSVRASLLTWQAIFKHSFRDPYEFCESLDLPNSFAEAAIKGQGQFQLFCPQPLADRIEHGNPNDPILRQVMPTIAESTVDSESEQRDPLSESQYQFAPGVLKKYEGRALLIVTGACGVNCRYCFRRFFPYSESPKSIADWEPSLKSIAADSSIEEIILSGGDPLSVTDGVLSELAHRLNSIKQIRRIRVHTRFPVVIPQRVCDGLLEWVASLNANVVFVVHCNHANEIDNSVKAALQKLRTANVTLMNQSVLLRGVNDHSECLIDLSRKLLDCNVIPYYLHQMDHVVGASHFHVPIEQGRQIVKEMRGKVSGYLVPRYVVEKPGELSKTIIQ